MLDFQIKTKIHLFQIKNCPKNKLEGEILTDMQQNLILLSHDQIPRVLKECLFTQDCVVTNVCESKHTEQKNKIFPLKRATQRQCKCISSQL